MKINHSIPQHNCFMIIQPARGGYTSRCRLVNHNVGEIYELTDIDSGVVITAELLEYCTYVLAKIPDILCYTSYGIGSEKLVPALMAKYSQLKYDSEIEVLLLRKLKKA